MPLIKILRFACLPSFSRASLISLLDLLSYSPLKLLQFPRIS